MQIVDMTNEEIKDAIDYMNEVPKNDPYFADWNFDESEWKSKKQELLDEREARNA